MSTEAYGLLEPNKPFCHNSSSSSMVRGSAFSFGNQHLTFANASFRSPNIHTKLCKFTIFEQVNGRFSIPSYVALNTTHYIWFREFGGNSKPSCFLTSKIKQQRRSASSPAGKSSMGEIAPQKSAERCLHQLFQMVMQYLVSSCVLLGIALLFALAISDIYRFRCSKRS